MKSVVGLMVVVLMAGSFAFAEEGKSSSTPADSVLSAVTGKEKKARKKKVEMCGECGKPESECECHGHKDESDKKKTEPSGR